jgi:predicted GIY-YIG superfamily endonuclease
MAEGAPGIVYLIHFARPYEHERHYVGWTRAPSRRFAAHLSGRGSPLVFAASVAGCLPKIVRTFQLRTRRTERWIKNQKNTGRYCPVCNPNPLTPPLE